MENKQITIVPDNLPTFDNPPKDDVGPIVGISRWRPSASSYIHTWIRIPIRRHHILTTVKEVRSEEVPVQVSFNPNKTVALAYDFQIIKRKNGKVLRFRVRIPIHTPGESVHLKLKIGLDDGRMKAVPELHFIDNHWIPIRVGIAPPKWGMSIIARIPLLGPIEEVPALEASIPEPGD